MILNPKTLGPRTWGLEDLHKTSGWGSYNSTLPRIFLTMKCLDRHAIYCLVSMYLMVFAFIRVCTCLSYLINAFLHALRIFVGLWLCVLTLVCTSAFHVPNYVPNICPSLETLVLSFLHRGEVQDWLYLNLPEEPTFVRNLLQGCNIHMGGHWWILTVHLVGPVSIW